MSEEAEEREIRVKDWESGLYRGDSDMWSKMPLNFVFYYQIQFAFQWLGLFGPMKQLSF